MGWIFHRHNSNTNEENLNIDLENPKPFFVDRTNDKIEWNSMIDSMLLPKTCEACNEHLIPNASCPCGCSSFVHRHGTVSFDLMIQRYLQKCNVKKLCSNHQGFKYLQSTREDFLRDNDDCD